MNGLEARFYTRGFEREAGRHGLKLRVNSLEWDAIGGPREGSITAMGGSESQLWELLEWLRRPVEICHPRTGEPVWWGFVNGVTVRVGAIEIGATLDSLVNRVAVAYSYVAPGTNVVGSRATTAWVQDDLSVATYGTKEFLSSCGGMTPQAAEARRTAILAAQRFPQGIAVQQTGGMLPRGRVRYSGAKNSRSATLSLRGWWSTLGWKYVSVPTITAVSYETTGAVEQAVGAADANQQVMQQVNIASQTVNAVTVQVNVRKVGNPADSLRVRVYSTIEDDDDPDKIGLPDQELGSALIAPLAIGTTAGWMLGNFSSEAELPAGKLYALVVDRVGAVDAANYYAVNVNEALGYGGGVFKVKNAETNTWAARSPDADMPFRIGVTNQVETTTQIGDLVRQGGQFMTGTEIVAGSGILLASYLRGDTTAITEIEDLLNSGGANGRRLLARVLPNRMVRVEEEPANTVVAAYLNGDGSLETRNNQPLDEFDPPVGQWVQLKGVIPRSVDMTRLITPELQFMEGASWSEGAGLRPRFRGQPSIDDVLAVRR